jgi:hypothetical protein
MVRSVLRRFNFRLLTRLIFWAVVATALVAAVLTVATFASIYRDSFYWLRLGQHPRSVFLLVEVWETRMLLVVGSYDQFSPVQTVPKGSTDKLRHFHYWRTDLGKIRDLPMYHHWDWFFLFRRVNEVYLHHGVYPSFETSLVPTPEGATILHRSIEVRFPVWLFIFPAIPSVAIRYSARRRRRIRAKHNLCVNCGYDLRHSVRRCPECGRAILNADN